MIPAEGADDRSVKFGADDMGTLRRTEAIYLLGVYYNPDKDIPADVQ